MNPLLAVSGWAASISASQIVDLVFILGRVKPKTLELVLGRIRIR